MNFTRELVNTVSEFLQTYMRKNNLTHLTADEAAELLAKNNILSNEIGPKPGYNFRQMLRDGRNGILPLVDGVFQERPNTRWIIHNTNKKTTRLIESNVKTPIIRIRAKKPIIVESLSQLKNPIYGLDPVIDNNSHLLILGTFPAIESIKAGFYYQNQNKRFWGQALSHFGDFESCSNNERKNLLKKNRIGLWDLFEAIEKNSDSNQDRYISKAKFNDFKSILCANSSVKILVFNGKTAYSWFLNDHHNLTIELGLKCVFLQSTSGSNGHFKSGKDWHDFFKSVKI